MKYQNLKAFQKHLKSAAPDHLSKRYLLAVSDDFERNQVTKEILGFISIPHKTMSCEGQEIRDILDEIRSDSLFGESVLVIERIEKLNQSHFPPLFEAISVSSNYLIFGAGSKVPVLATFMEKEGIVLDLLAQKPWDLEKMLQEQLIEKAADAKKRLDSSVLSLLFERIGSDPALLMSEMDKLICYVGDQEVIAPQDVLAISAMSKNSTLWQIAEEVIWEKKEFADVEESAFHALIPILRNQLHLGLSLATLIEEKRSADEWSAFLPKLWPKLLNKRTSQAAELKSSYFQKGLHALFEVELKSRSSSNQLLTLLDQFRVNLHAC